MINEIANTEYAKINTSIFLRGHSFSRGSIVRVWNASGILSIQPLSKPGPLWYALPGIHYRHVSPLEEDILKFEII